MKLRVTSLMYFHSLTHLIIYSLFFISHFHSCLSNSILFSLVDSLRNFRHRILKLTLTPRIFFSSDYFLPFLSLFSSFFSSFFLIFYTVAPISIYTPNFLCRISNFNVTFRIYYPSTHFLSSLSLFSFSFLHSSSTSYAAALTIIYTPNFLHRTSNFSVTFRIYFPVTHFLPPHDFRSSTEGQLRYPENGSVFVLFAN